jgi:3-methyladenine DNA glycosylase/8-oxoguanine DNA glycosylase
MNVAVRERRWRAAHPVSLRLLLGVHARGAGDPTYVSDRSGAVWRTARTPDGPGTARFALESDVVAVTAWGDGAQWLCEMAPAWLGAEDDLSDWAPDVPVLRDGTRRTSGPRVGRTGLVMEALLPAILEQKVTGGEARRAWRWLVRRYGEPAPGPAAGMAVVPEPSVWRSIPSWDWHRAGVGPQRSATAVRAAGVAARLEEAVGMPPEQADQRLQAVPGVGAWTSAEVRQRALGDADAVSVGDAHVPRMITWALTGQVSDSDDDMLRALEPYLGHRFRVQRVLELTGVSGPRFGPKYSPHDFRGM